VATASFRVAISSIHQEILGRLRQACIGERSSNAIQGPGSKKAQAGYLQKALLRKESRGAYTALGDKQAQAEEDLGRVQGVAEM